MAVLCAVTAADNGDRGKIGIEPDQEKRKRFRFF
jgi:hypothetical protein